MDFKLSDEDKEKLANLVPNEWIEGRGYSFTAAIIDTEKFQEFLDKCKGPSYCYQCKREIKEGEMCCATGYNEETKEPGHIYCNDCGFPK